MTEQTFSTITPELKALSDTLESAPRIDPELYTKYDVKRGLRDLNGRGVMTAPQHSRKI